MKGMHEIEIGEVDANGRGYKPRQEVGSDI